MMRIMVSKSLAMATLILSAIGLIAFLTAAKQTTPAIIVAGSLIFISVLLLAISHLNLVEKIENDKEKGEI